jgi:hypothetical protein
VKKLANGAELRQCMIPEIGIAPIVAVTLLEANLKGAARHVRTSTTMLYTQITDVRYVEKVI